MEKQIIDVHSTTSNRSGLGGLIETIMRKFRTPFFCLALAPIGLAYVLAMGLSLSPAVMIYRSISELTLSAHPIFSAICLGISIAAGYFSYGLTLIFVVPLFNLPLLFLVRPVRASWFSLSVIPWYYHNALTYLVRYTFLDFITPTPLNRLFFQMMGMKIGRGTMINTSNISDPCLICLGDFVTIGGSATLVAHYGMKGMLIIDRLTVEDQVTIGLKASLFGDVVVGKGSTVKAHDVVFPKTRIQKEVKDKESAA